ncbi:MAG: DUF6465 family protein [Oscillospiraceae bacterium]|nr:DUF6465 family protein [Oscillospiraceae bacterium]MDY6207621.1 DUF6465 family protein [Oscillospiraceae bacterium]
MAKDKKTQSKPAVSAEAAKPAETVKAVENVKPAEEVKAAPAEKKAEKPAPAKTAEKPVAEKKTVKPAAEKKTEKPAPKKAEPVKKDIFLIQGAGEHTVADITELCKADYKNGSRKHVKSIDIYVKSENGELRAYYVVNGNPEGKYIVL